MTEKLYASIQSNNKFHTDIYGNNHECNIHIFNENLHCFYIRHQLRLTYSHKSDNTCHVCYNTFYDRKLSTSMCETSQVLLAGVPGGFSRVSLASAHIKY